MLAAVTSLILSPLAAQGSGAAGADTPSADGRAQALEGRVTAPEHCAQARRGLAFYRTRAAEWRAKLGAAEDQGFQRRSSGQEQLLCPRIRYLAERWRAKARATRRAFEAWHRYHYAWREWLPAVWKAIIQCETRSDFRWDSGTYEGAFGFHRSSWDAFRLPGYPREAYLATPRQQYEVALAIWRRYGFSGWGCAR